MAKTRCSKCKKAKEASSYYPGRRTCKACLNKRRQERRAEAKQRRGDEPALDADLDATRRCSICGRIKPLTEYSRDLRAPDGVHSQCKACRAAAAAQRRSETVEPTKPRLHLPYDDRMRLTPQVFAQIRRLRDQAEMFGTDVAWAKLGHHVASLCDTLGPSRVTPNLHQLNSDIAVWHRSHAAKFRPDDNAIEDAAADRGLLQRLADEVVHDIGEYLADLSVLAPAWRAVLDGAPDVPLPPIAGYDAAERPAAGAVEVPTTFVAASAETIATCRELDWIDDHDNAAAVGLAQIARSVDQHRERATHQLLRQYAKTLNAYLLPYFPPIIQRLGGEEFVTALRDLADRLWPSCLAAGSRALIERRRTLGHDLNPPTLTVDDYRHPDYRATLLTCPPTPRTTMPHPAAPTNRLPHVALIAAWQNHSLLPWQCLYAHAITQRRPEGRWWHETDHLSICRQGGKTEIFLDLDLDQIILDVSGPRPRKRITTSSNNIVDAANKLIEEQWPELVAAGIDSTAGLKLRQNLAGPSVTRHHPDGGRIRIIPASDNAGHGGTNDRARIDEGHSYPDGAKKTAFLPSTRAVDGQFTVGGTKGPNDGSADWFHTELEQSRTNAAAGNSAGTHAHFEWAPPEGSDPTDRAIWGPAIPSLGHVLRWDRLEIEFRERDSNASFARSSCNLLIDEAENSVIEPDKWLTACDPLAEVDTGQRLVLAADIAPNDRAHTHVTLTDGATVEMARNAEGTDWLPEYVRQSVRANPNIAAIAIWANGPLQDEADDIAALKLPRFEVIGLDYPARVRASRDLVDAIERTTETPGVTIRSNPRIDDAVKGAERRRAQGDAGYTFQRRNRKDGDISALNAVAFGFSAHPKGSRPTEQFSPRDHRERRTIYAELFGDPVPHSRHRDQHTAEWATVDDVFADRHGRPPHTPKQPQEKTDE